MGWKLADFETAVRARVGVAAAVCAQEIENAVFLLSRTIQLEVEEEHVTTVSVGLTSIDRPWYTSKVENVWIPSVDLEIFEISRKERQVTKIRDTDKVFYWMTHNTIEFSQPLDHFAAVGAKIWTRFLQHMTVPTGANEFNGPDVMLQTVISIASYQYMLKRLGDYVENPGGYAGMTLSELQDTVKIYKDDMESQMEGIQIFWRNRRYSDNPAPQPSGRRNS